MLPGISLTLDLRLRRRGSTALPNIGGADLPVRRNYDPHERNDAGGHRPQIE